MEQEDESQEQGSRAPRSLFILLMLVIIVSRSATSIFTPVWLDALDNNSTLNGTDHCGKYIYISYKHIDPFTTIFIINFLFFVLFGFVLLLTKIVCPYLITDRERNYDKREFALIGFSDSLAAICFVYASSGCRTAPYLQSIAANFAVPVTFCLRFIILRKRPTMRKTVCAILVLFAEVTAMMPEIVPGMESARARHDEGGASGLQGILWPICYFTGYVPTAFVSIIIEKAVKPRSYNQGRDSSELNIAYVLFWCYLFSLLTLVLLFWTDLIPGFGMSDNLVEFAKISELNIAYVLFWCYLFSLLTLILLFWTDLIPGFGTADNLVEFAKMFYFNIKCYLGFEGCVGFINVVSIVCTVCLVINRIANSYFLRYMEGANYLVIITSIQTPVVFIFFTLFEENPVKWHPHAYLSTWLSIAALCIMIPAIYIYDTGAPEVNPDFAPHIDAGTQYDETRPLTLDEEGNQPINTQYGTTA